MKFIQVHNYYQQAGGEDSVVQAELNLLCTQGHEVVTYYKNNKVLGNGLWALGKASVQTLWNQQVYREFRALLQAENPDVVHCHNTFPLISPSIYWACAKEKVPVVQTLHNYRLLCLNAFLFRENRYEALGTHEVRLEQSDGSEASTHEGEDGETDCGQRPPPNAHRLLPSRSGSICEKCLSKSLKWPGVHYGCYRESKVGSLVVALMLFVHKLIGTWSKKVTAYIALTEFQKKKMIEGGLPAEKIFVKPNFIADSAIKEPLVNSHQPPALETESSVTSIENPYCLFVGRLSPEKGCDVLIQAWTGFQKELLATSCELSAKETPQLLIVGDGPDRVTLDSLTSDLGLLTSVSFLGQQPKERVLSLMHNAQFLVLPSVWYEGFPMTIVESFSCGTPVVASDDGGMGEVIIEKLNGLKFLMGDSSSLFSKLEWAFTHPEEMMTMGESARQVFDQKYSAEANYAQLLDVYKHASNINAALRV